MFRIANFTLSQLFEAIGRIYCEWLSVRINYSKLTMKKHFILKMFRRKSVLSYLFPQVKVYHVYFKAKRLICFLIMAYQIFAVQEFFGDDNDLLIEVLLINL